MSKPWAVYKAAQRGVAMQRCERCGATEHLQRHHADYGRPLEVVVLCQTCHAALHVAAGTWATMRRKRAETQPMMAEVLV
jgi:hypothetical protein